jgi:hypothetical protein
MYQVDSVFILHHKIKKILNIKEIHTKFTCTFTIFVPISTLLVVQWSMVFVLSFMKIRYKFPKIITGFTDGWHETRRTDTNKLQICYVPQDIWTSLSVDLLTRMFPWANSDRDNNAYKCLAIGRTIWRTSNKKIKKTLKNINFMWSDSIFHCHLYPHCWPWRGKYKDKNSIRRNVHFFYERYRKVMKFG